MLTTHVHRPVQFAGLSRAKRRLDSVGDDEVKKAFRGRGAEGWSQHLHVALGRGAIIYAENLSPFSMRVPVLCILLAQRSPMSPCNFPFEIQTRTHRQLVTLVQLQTIIAKNLMSVSLLDLIALERRPTGDERVKYAAHRPKISGHAMRLLSADFRSNIVRCAAQREVLFIWGPAHTDKSRICQSSSFQSRYGQSQV